MLCITHAACSSQDYAVRGKQILANWVTRKISHQVAREDVIRSRDPAGLRLVAHIDFVRSEEEAQLARDSEAAALKEMTDNLGEFKHHPSIDEWKIQYAMTPKPSRFGTLLLRGPSRGGKTQKGNSLFGVGATLNVNCQGLGKNLPSLRGFRETQHRAILFDEISEEQVLANKLLFQAGPWQITLGQSACNQHAYTKQFHGVAMICCSNTFRMPPHEALSPEDGDWLRKNVVQVAPLDGGKWYYDSSDSEGEVSDVE